MIQLQNVEEKVIPKVTPQKKEISFEKVGDDLQVFSNVLNQFISDQLNKNSLKKESRDTTTLINQAENGTIKSKSDKKLENKNEINQNETNENGAYANVDSEFKQSIENSSIDHGVDANQSHHEFDNQCVDSYLESEVLEAENMADLNQTERKIVDQYMQNFLDNKNKNGFFIEKNTHINGSPMPFLTPPALLNVENVNTHNTKKIDILTNDLPIKVMAENFQNIEESTSQNQSGFGQFSNDRQQNSVQEQSKVLQSSMTSGHSTEFISYIKEQFEKFQNNQDKKVTLHIRDGSKNLTMIFDMKNDDDIHVLFRTTDKEWKSVLEKNKLEIKDALNNTNHHIDIRYLGE